MNVSKVQIFTVCLVVFMGFFGFSQMTSVFTPMILHDQGDFLSASASIGIRTTILGVLLGVYPLGQFLGAPLLGALSDRFGRRRLLLISLVFSTIWYVLISTGLAIHSLVLVGVAALIAGFSEGNIVMAQSALAASATGADRQQLFGYVYLSRSLGFILGPLAGGVLANPGFVSWFTFATPFWLATILIALTFFAVLFFFRDPHFRRQDVSFKAIASNLSQVVTDRRLRPYYLVNFLLYLAVFGFFRLYPLYIVDEFHLRITRLSFFIAWTGVVIVSTNLWLTGFLARKMAPYRLTILAGLGLAISLVIVVLPPWQAALWVTLFFVSLCIGLCLPACAVLLSSHATDEEQGRVMGNNQSMQVLAEGLSAIAGGLLAAIVVKLPLLVAAAAALIGVALLWRFKDKR